MVKVTVLVEGAGEDNSLKSVARQNLACLLSKLRLTSKPSIEFHGTRRAAFDRLRHALGRPSNGTCFFLLVDAEEPFVLSTDPNEKHHRWAHVRNRNGDNWPRPDTATDEHLHFMATAMETWIIADQDAIRSRFPKEFNDRAITDDLDWENLSTDRVQALLRKATGERYKKGKVSFELLGRVDPQTLRAKCLHAERFFSALERLLGSNARS